MEENRTSTDELLNQLFKEQNLKCFFDQDSSDFILPAFNEYITSVCKQQLEMPEHIIARANLEKSYGHQLFSGRRHPSRDTVIRLAFGFRMDVDQTQEMLKIARKSPLYPRVKRDSAIIYCLYHHISLVNTQIILHDLELPILGSERNSD